MNVLRASFSNKIRVTHTPTVASHPSCILSRGAPCQCPHTRQLRAVASGIFASQVQRPPVQSQRPYCSSKPSFPLAPDQNHWQCPSKYRPFLHGDLGAHLTYMRKNGSYADDLHIKALAVATSQSVADEQWRPLVRMQ